jgi:hypothetical protein
MEQQAFDELMRGFDARDAAHKTRYEEMKKRAEERVKFLDALLAKMEARERQARGEDGFDG